MYQHQDQTLETGMRTTAHITNTMKILGMSSEEIREKVEGELSINPFLEVLEERICPTCKRHLPENGKCPYCSAPAGAETEDVVFVTPRDDYGAGHYTATPEDYHDQEEIDAASNEELPAYVLKQIAPDLVDDQEKMVAAYLLTSLDEDGFITCDLFEIAQYYHILPSKITKIIELIQHADPLGVGSRDYKEALTVQIKHISDFVRVPKHTTEIINEHFEDLTHGRYSEIARDYGITQTEVRKVEKFIGDNLNPFPARAHWGENRHGKMKNQVNAFHDPDIIITYRDDNPNNPLVVEVVSPIVGYLQVNQYIRNELRNAPSEKSEEWHTDLDKASLLVKSVYQRNNTVAQLMRFLVEQQGDFIRYGDEHLKSLTRADAARYLNVHESTISRAAANKTAILPNRRVVPLSVFFDRSLNVRTIIKDLIRDEKKPLTDADLVKKLQEMGMDVARRTVAKYRLMEGIGSVHERAAAKRRNPDD